MSIGSKIKERRLSLDYTLETLADKVGTSKQTIHRYENGIISNIPSDRIEALAAALKTTPAFLMGWEDNKAVLEEKSLSSLTPKEKMLVSAYRAHPEMQSAVDTLLGIQNNAAPQPAPQKLYEGRVAAFGAGPETIYYTEEDMENIRKAKEEYFATHPETEDK